MRPHVSCNGLLGRGALLLAWALVALPRSGYADEKPDTSQAWLDAELLKTRKARIRAYPFAFYTPETEVAVGAGGIVTFYTAPDRLLRPSKVTLSAYYSTRKQYEITLRPELYMVGNTLFLSARLNFGDFVHKFWGIGRDSPDIDTENYDSRSWGAWVNFQFPPLLKFMPHNKSGVIYDFRRYQVINPRDNPHLKEGEVTGRRGGYNSGIGVTLVWDSRDHIFYPTKGGFYQGKAIFYMRAIGSSFNFGTYEIDLRWYFSLSRKRHSVLAIQAFGKLASGNPPFYELPGFGSSTIMRGYFTGRYRDKTFVAGQVEYRTRVWWRFGLVGFAALGDVQQTLTDFDPFDAKFSLGAGLRFLFDEKQQVNVRMDIGFGRDTSGVYFGLEEAF